MTFVESEGLRRRAFLTRFGASAAGVAAAVTLPDIARGQRTENASANAIPLPPGVTERRLAKAFDMRVQEAIQDATAGPAVNFSNDDLTRYPDRAGTYTKALPHDEYGRVDPTAFASFTKALETGDAADFSKIIMGGTRTLNGPQAGLCYELDMLDCSQFGQPQVPPAPALAGDQTAVELVEHYWGSLLRDVAFTDYDSNPIAAQAATEMSSFSRSAYTGPRDSSGWVTPALLFRGGFPGETVGPYLSQFLLQPAFLGSQPITQQLHKYVAGIDFATDFASWLDIQNGVDTGLRNQYESNFQFLHNGRGLATLTHEDVLFQEYFTAFLVLASMNASLPGGFSAGGAPVNPGNPYANSKTQNGFGTFGSPDFSATLGAVATKALNAVWYQKWYVHLRLRPEAVGGLVHLIRTGQQNRTDAQLSNLVLNSQAVQQSHKKWGSYLLSQAFPEGSPAHPAYPTGHGTVAGACITALKFFYDGDFVIPNPIVPASDGSTLLPYTGSDAGQITVNGELNKLGHNVSFGHGIHSGIHWRSDTDTSLLFGEAVALSYLSHRARTYNEPFTVKLTKFDGTVATITNQ